MPTRTYRAYGEWTEIVEKDYDASDAREAVNLFRSEHRGALPHTVVLGHRTWSVVGLCRYCHVPLFADDAHEERPVGVFQCAGDCLYDSL